MCFLPLVFNLEFVECKTLELSGLLVSGATHGVDVEVFILAIVYSVHVMHRVVLH